MITRKPGKDREREGHLRSCDWNTYWNCRQPVDHSCSWGHYDSTMHCNIVIDALQDSPWSEGKVSIHSLQSLYEETSGPARKDFLGCCNIRTMNF